VFVVDQGRLRRRDIGGGLSNATDYEVSNGITEQDIVALPGALELQDGLAVIISSEK
jgi:hypothetical protein